MTMYRRHAGSYSHATGIFNWLRRQAVDLLKLRPGSTVIDVGCGTGLCFRYLQQAIGPTGLLIAVEESEQMLTHAMAAADRAGWRNIAFVHAAAQDAVIPAEADAALFCATHDILRCSTAVKNVLTNVTPGGRVAATGGKWPAPWLWPLHALVAATHAPYVSSLDGFDRPWGLLAEHCTDLDIRSVAYDTGYLASGTVR